MTQLTLVAPEHGGMRRTANVSPCGRYRYALSRVWDPKRPTYLAIGLNPSTADASIDDATVRRWIGYGRSWGFGGFHVANLYAYRATDPREMWKARAVGLVDIVGPENDLVIGYQIKRVAPTGLVLCCWGNNADDERAQEVADLIRSWGVEPKALALTKSGKPQHPLRLPGHLKPRPLSELRREAAYAR
jgi:hypothetical protein